jgi:hypothetical protein
MSDDYLWDRSGPPDPEVERLEKLLGTLRHNRPAPDFRMPVRRFPARIRAMVPRFAAVAAVLLFVLGATLLMRLYVVRPAWNVAALQGTPQVGARSLAKAGRLVVGEWLETDSSSIAMLDVGLIGEVEVKPGSLLRLVRADVSDHRIALQRGKIFARIWAPPRLFSVETPSALAVDLGCVYTLQVDASGASLMHVDTGLVTLQGHGRESLVPAGAMCLTRRGAGPGTPYYQDASEELKQALQRLDVALSAAAGGVPGGVEGGIEGAKKVRAASLEAVLAESRKKDALTLWHLLVRVSGEEQLRVFDRLAQLVPPPQGVTREGVLRGDAKMRDAWADQLGIGSMSWWRWFWNKSRDNLTR